MNNFLILCVLFLTLSCSQSINDNIATEEPKRIITEKYEITIPQKQDALLILFPCFPCDAKNTKTEFDIENIAVKNNIAVLFMNFNQHLWLSEDEEKALENIILKAIAENNVSMSNTFIGGFSGGGNTSILLSNFLKKSNSKIQPNGVFIVDSPIDLVGLYENAQKNIIKNYSPVAVEESQWIVKFFDAEFGQGDSSLANYENKSPYISKTHSLNNLAHLKDLKIRLYSEPDTLWWKENRQTGYEDMNAFYIEQLALDLAKLHEKSTIEYIKTENKGYRTNGERHPHSWSIVDTKHLVQWILKE